MSSDWRRCNRRRGRTPAVEATDFRRRMGSDWLPTTAAGGSGDAATRRRSFPARAKQRHPALAHGGERRRLEAKEAAAGGDDGLATAALQLDGSGRPTKKTAAFGWCGGEGGEGRRWAATGGGDERRRRRLLQLYDGDGGGLPAAKKKGEEGGRRRRRRKKKKKKKERTKRRIRFRGVTIPTKPGEDLNVLLIQIDVHPVDVRDQGSVVILFQVRVESSNKKGLIIDLLDVEEIEEVSTFEDNPCLTWNGVMNKAGCGESGRENLSVLKFLREPHHLCVVVEPKERPVE
ncbi:unnamed protein product, partial [Cuscuta campestris]